MTTPEETRHAIGHMRYLTARASPEDSEVCFDYEITLAVLAEIERLREALRDIAIGCGESILIQDAMRARAYDALNETNPEWRYMTPDEIASAYRKKIGRE